MGNFLAAFRKNRTKIWVGAVTLLLVLYLVVSFQRSVLLLMDNNMPPKPSAPRTWCCRSSVPGR